MINRFEPRIVAVETMVNLNSYELHLQQFVLLTPIRMNYFMKYLVVND